MTSLDMKDEKRGMYLYKSDTIFPWSQTRSQEKKASVFVNVTRKKWTASKHSVICSVHFAPKDFSHLSYYGQKYQWPLKRDEIGVISVPSMHSVKTPEEETNRDIRMKCHEVSHLYIIKFSMRYMVRKQLFEAFWLHEKV